MLCILRSMPWRFRTEWQQSAAVVSRPRFFLAKLVQAKSPEQGRLIAVPPAGGTIRRFRTLVFCTDQRRRPAAC